jgi:hypothetical protein
MFYTVASKEDAHVCYHWMLIPEISKLRFCSDKKNPEFIADSGKLFLNMSIKQIL